MHKQLLMRVQESFALMGLGVLALPEEVDARLLTFDLHTVLAVQLIFPDGYIATGIASIEEVSRPSTDTAAGTETRALLLTHEAAAPLPTGTCIYELSSMY